MNASQTLGQPLTLPNGSVVPNRFAKSALSETLGSVDLRVTKALPKLYQRWAEGGTGLGLSIVKHLVTSMGGDVGMEPNFPTGSVFWFTIPSA